VRVAIVFGASGPGPKEEGTVTNVVLMRRGTVDGGALVVFTHVVAIFVIWWRLRVFASSIELIPINMIAILSCRKDHLASLHLTRKCTLSTVGAD
jgi:hypothetical protein